MPQAFLPPRRPSRRIAFFAFASVSVLAVVNSGCMVHHAPANTNPLAAVKSEQPDKVLFDIAMHDLDKNNYTVARLNLETLLNTYPDSEYLARAKMAIADSWYREGGIEGMAQAEAQYKDFITFFPEMKEASEAQLKIATIHYRQLEKPDRDATEGLRAQAELRTFLLNYPDSPLRPQALQMLRDTQEILAEREYRIADFYLQRAQQGEYSDFRPAQSRLEETLDKFPLYSQGDVALDQLARSYVSTSRLYGGAAGLETNPASKVLYTANSTSDRNKAIADFGREITRYPESPLVKDATKNLAALEAPVPTPSAEAVAFNKQEIAGHVKPPSDRGWRYGFGMDTLVTGKPRTELARADKVGQPSLVEQPPPPAETAPGLTEMIADTMKALGDSAATAQITAALTGAASGAGNDAAVVQASSGNAAGSNTVAATATAPLAFQDVTGAKPQGADTPQTNTPQAVSGSNDNDPNARRTATAAVPSLVLTPNEVDLETQEQIIATDVHRQVPPPVAEIQRNAKLQAQRQAKVQKQIKAAYAKAAAGKGQTQPSASPSTPDTPVAPKKSWFHIW